MLKGLLIYYFKLYIPSICSKGLNYIEYKQISFGKSMSVFISPQSQIKKSKSLLHQWFI